jgi:formamidopyrimidine-DNA glycosylase
MPELPDVEIFRKYFDSTSLNKTIEKVEVPGPEMLSGVKKNELIKVLTGQKFITSARHGKYMFAAAQNKKVLVMHFGMTGYLKIFSGNNDKPKYIKMLISFKNDKLAFDDRRKLGLISLTDDIQKYIKDKNLGPDALDNKLKFKDFYSAVSKRTAPVKSVLMNQEIIAGIGNIYADEILFQSGIDPHSAVKNIPENNLKEIFNNIRKVLKGAVKAEADSSAFPEDYLTKRRKKGKTCPLCGGDIIISKIGGRTTYYCKEHQKSFS